MFWNLVVVLKNVWFHQHCPIRSPSIFDLVPRKLNMRFKKFPCGQCCLIRRRFGPRKVKKRLEKRRSYKYCLIRCRSRAPWTDLAPECFRFPPQKWTPGLTNNRMQPGLRWFLFVEFPEPRVEDGWPFCEKMWWLLSCMLWRGISCLKKVALGRYRVEI